MRGVIEVSVVMSTVTSDLGDEATAFMFVPGSHELTACVLYGAAAFTDMSK